ncbi:hypothetical protein CCHR01_00196 [Colletotrichum chrysophilum]|uniref:Uncharacterized protein n=1 Tax=Colletotrichum chrysophilum TaxID=1836956 RepID=A0AAD9B0P2_9PEZI|nr:hypothetical protein CCHR01_00196 [Colletotrichum chrysophilum]
MKGTFADGAIALMYDFDEKAHQRERDFAFATRTLSEFAIEGMIQERVVIEAVESEEEPFVGTRSIVDIPGHPT